MYILIMGKTIEEITEEIIAEIIAEVKEGNYSDNSIEDPSSLKNIMMKMLHRNIH